MILRVVYTSGETGLVKSSDLESLIKEEQIVAFCRSDGWVRIGFDPIRYMQRTYSGPGNRWSDISPNKSGGGTDRLPLS
jgi:hypothetical protein